MSVVIGKKYIADKQKIFENESVIETEAGNSSTSVKSPDFTLYLAVTKIYPIDVASLSQGQEIPDINVYQVRADDVLSIHKAIYIFKPDENKVVFLYDNGILTTETIENILNSQQQDDKRAIGLFQNDFQQYSDYLFTSIMKKRNNVSTNIISASKPMMMMPQSGRSTSIPSLQQQDTNDNQKSLENAHQMVSSIVPLNRDNISPLYHIIF